MNWIDIKNKIPQNLKNTNIGDNEKDVAVEFCVIDNKGNQYAAMGRYVENEEYPCSLSDDTYLRTGFHVCGGDWDDFFHAPDFVSYQSGYCELEKIPENASRVTHWRYVSIPLIEGSLCPNCKEKKLEICPEDEPWSPEHLACPGCDSTYCIEQEYVI